MNAGSTKVVRCAIYTRVSTDQGLEQDFNSLDAQYDASQAYIRSQAHAGWSLLRSKYDDGGLSGGNTDRPALQRLLEDVRAGRVSSHPSTKLSTSRFSPAVPIYFPTTFRSASLILSCQPGPAS
jgi:hypothetical protein